MKNKKYIGIIKPSDIETGCVECFDGSFKDVSSFCGVVGPMDLGKHVYQWTCGIIEVENNFTKYKRIKQPAASSLFKQD